MKYQPVNIDEKFKLFSEHWSPKIIAQINDYHIKIAKIQGDFVWHSHNDTDELFMVIEGSLRIDFRDGEVNLNKGDLYIVPKGVEHKPYAGQECKILLIEPSSTINTGEVESELTKKVLEII
ncbi:MAG: cupin domain-containing protein [Candidatus Kapabacteria bacterium]|nr:cupin domain-containing protein [Ignavibacteriota bacterium]MCW5884132.1 cupin domain-containing protein [Candidatus Kapabacteria bacterium]